MPSLPPRVLWITDVDYPARGRDYGAEDRWLIGELGDRFAITPCNPRSAPDAMDDADLVVVRNSGPVAGYAEAHAAFRQRAETAGTRVYNELTGRGDMLGKQYLLDMHDSGMPVIPTVRAGNVPSLPEVDQYVAKPVHGADSEGLRFLDRDAARSLDQPDVIVQPRIDMRAELSFVFVDAEFQYALSTSPDQERWELHEHEASAADIAFARQFVAWNDIEHGIQRVDACRLPDDSLLLVELEDLNPYLSLELLAAETRQRFVASFADALHRILAA